MAISLVSAYLSLDEEYAATVFIPYISRCFQFIERVDIVWDRYVKNSLKTTTREKRGQAKGVRRKVSASTKLPGNWQDFLHDDTNKEELFAFLTNAVTCHNFPDGKMVVATLGVNVRSNGHYSMDVYTQEEADTRMMVHLKDMIDNGSKTICVKTVDSDVMVILVGLFYKIKRSENVGNIWLEYGTGTNLRFFNVRDLYNSVGETKARGLLFFHAFTGSDTTSALRNKGKKSAWNTWRAFDEITPVFSNLSKQPFKIINSDSQEMAMLQRFVVCLYIKSSPLERVNDARKEIFCHKNQNMESLPPTENALLQHVKRCIYQVGVWYNSFYAHPLQPYSPVNYGWREDESGWTPVWITIPEVALSCRDLIKCGCKTNCISARCKCCGADLPCCHLCSCKCLTPVAAFSSGS